MNAPDVMRLAQLEGRVTHWENECNNLQGQLRFAERQLDKSRAQLNEARDAFHPPQHRKEDQ